MEKITPSQIDKIVQKSIDNLKQNFRTIDGQSGWHQHLGANKVGNIGTAQGLLILNYFNSDFNNKYLAVEFLRQSQFKGTGNSQIDGGWSYVSNLNRIPTTESTAWALLGLFNEVSREDETVKNGLNWLLNNHLNTDNDKGWGSLKNDESRVYATCLVLRVLKKYNLGNISQFQKGYNWLKQARNTDNGWGDKFGHPSTITHTAHALIALLECGEPKDSGLIQQGSNWLVGSFEEDKFWIDVENGGLLEFMDINVVQNGNIYPHRISYYHFSTPYAIIALIKAGLINLSVVFKGLDYLIQSNSHGNWEHPFLANQRIHPIWAIHDSLLAFKTFKENCNNWNEIESIILKGNSVSFKYKKIDNFVLNFIIRFMRNKIVWGILVLIPISLILKYTGSIEFVEKQPILWIVVIPLLVSIIANLLTKD